MLCVLCEIDMAPSPPLLQGTRNKSFPSEPYTYYIKRVKFNLFFSYVTFGRFLIICPKSGGYPSMRAVYVSTYLTF
jgi:hypothetical protein